MRSRDELPAWMRAKAPSTSRMRRPLHASSPGTGSSMRRGAQHSGSASPSHSMSRVVASRTEQFRAHARATCEPKSRTLPHIGRVIAGCAKDVTGPREVVAPLFRICPRESPTSKANGRHRSRQHSGAWRAGLDDSIIKLGGDLGSRAHEGARQPILPPEQMHTADRSRIAFEHRAASIVTANPVERDLAGVVDLADEALDELAHHRHIQRIEVVSSSCGDSRYSGR